MSNDAGWYFESLGESSGPFSAKEMQELAKRGAIEPLTMVKKGSGGEWVPAESVKGFEFGKAPPVEIEANPVKPPPVDKAKSMKKRSSAEVGDTFVAIWLLFRIALVMIGTLVVGFVFYNPPTDRFQEDNAVGATANALERLEYRIGAIFAFCLAVFFIRSLQKVGESWNKP